MTGKSLSLYHVNRNIATEKFRIVIPSNLNSRNGIKSWIMFMLAFFFFQTMDDNDYNLSFTVIIPIVFFQGKGLADFHPASYERRRCIVMQLVNECH